MMTLATRRQGVAARLLELKYTVGKNAASSGGDDVEGVIAAQREQVRNSRDQLAFLDAEIAALLDQACR